MSFLSHGSTVYLLLAVAASACASSHPVMAGGRTTPIGRKDVLVGAALRTGLGGSRSTGGVAPMVATRAALNDRWDLGLMATGATLHLEGRLHLPQMRTIVAVRPFAGAATQNEGNDVTDADALLGFNANAVYSGIVSDLFEYWVGPSLTAERWLGLGDRGTQTRVHLGGVVGLAAGFRNLFVMLELGVAHGWLWDGQTRSGIVLTPASALRYRF